MTGIVLFCACLSTYSRVNPKRRVLIVQSTALDLPDPSWCQLPGHKQKAECTGGDAGAMRWLSRHRGAARDARMDGPAASPASWKGRSLLGLTIFASKPLTSVFSKRKSATHHQAAPRSVLLGIAFAEARSASPEPFVPVNPATEWVDDPCVHGKRDPSGEASNSCRGRGVWGDLREEQEEEGRGSKERRPEEVQIEEDDDEEEGVKVRCLCCTANSRMGLCIAESIEVAGGVVLLSFASCLHACADALA